MKEEAEAEGVGRGSVVSEMRGMEARCLDRSRWDCVGREEGVSRGVLVREGWCGGGREGGDRGK